jgi:hypothetical protein
VFEFPRTCDARISAGRRESMAQHAAYGGR